MTFDYNELLKRISQAEKAEIDGIFSAAYYRYQTLNPEWDIFYISLPKSDPDSRQAQLDALMEYIRNTYKKAPRTGSLLSCRVWN